MKNFWLSLLAYFVMSFLGGLCLLLLNVTTRVPNVVTDPPRNAPWWIEIMLWLHVFGSIALYFYFGTRVKLMSNRLLSFLSVSGNLLLGFFVIFLWIYSNQYLVMIGGLSFIRLTILLGEGFNNEYPAILIVSVLPTLLIWLGMLHKIKCRGDGGSDISALAESNPS